MVNQIACYFVKIHFAYFQYITPKVPGKSVGVTYKYPPFLLNVLLIPKVISIFGAKNELIMKIRISIFSLAFLLLAGLASSQTSFLKTFGGPGTDIANYILELPDGYLVAGTTSSFGDGSLDGYLLRLELNGDLLWQKVYGSGSNDVFTAVAEAESDGFLAVGFTTGGFMGTQDIIITRVDAFGSVLWSKTAGGSADDYARAVIRIADGYIISGGQSSLSAGTVDGFIMRIDNDGNVVWSKSYGSAVANIIYAEYEENGVLYAGGGADAAGALLRLSTADGSVLSGSLANGNSTESLYYIRPAADGNLLQSDHSWSPSGGVQIRQWTRKTDRAGNVLWSKAYSAPGADLRGRAEPCSDGGSLLVPYENFSKSTAEPVLVRLDSAGNVRWSYRYGGGALDRLYKGEQTADGGFVAAGHTRSSAASNDDDILVIKTKPNGMIDGCCIGTYPVAAEDYSPPVTSFTPTAYPFLGAQPQFQFGLYTLLNEGLSCFIPNTVVTDSIRFCSGDTVLVGGMPYSESGTVQMTLPGQNGCDTVMVYTLIKEPLPTRFETIARCAGESVSVAGNIYTQSTTVFDTLAAATGCDTVAVYTLLFQPLPTRVEIVEFCPGNTATVNGMVFTQPDTVIQLVPAAVGCDTVVTYIARYYDLPQPASVQLNCPAAITVNTTPGADSARVFYNAPAGGSDCICGGYSIELLEGLPTGSWFPTGTTQVCYEAQDSCGNVQNCCFEVTVQDQEEACDIKTLGCVKFELLTITADAARRHTYRIRVTNNCANKMLYFVAQTPAGTTATAPGNNTVFVSENDRSYTVRNPNFSPFYSVKFTPVADGLVSGQSDIFQYTLPTQAGNPWYIHTAVRLQFSEIISTHLNTFFCPVGVTPTGTASRSEPEPVEDDRAHGAHLLYPNPASDVLYADFSAWPHAPRHARILDLRGRQLWEKELPQNARQDGIPIEPEWPAGVYFLEITAADGTRSIQRFAVQPVGR